MLPILAFSLTVANAGAPVTLHVPSDAQQIFLRCGSQEFQLTPQNGMVTFDRALDHCDVSMKSHLGEFGGAGEFTCTSSGCSLIEVQHAAVSNAPGRLNVILAGTHSSRWLEVTCPSGLRDRADLHENTATFNNIPNEACTLHFKGGAPGTYRSVSPGTYKCVISQDVPVCSIYNL